MMGGNDNESKSKPACAPTSSEKKDNALKTTSETAEASAAPPRRKSDVTEVTNDEQVADGNSTPLLSLVTAASRLLDNENNEKEKNDLKASKAVVDQAEDLIERSASKIQEEKAESQTGSTEKKTSFTTERSKNAKDSSVIRGTKEDLMRNPNQKPTFAEQLYDILGNEEHHDVLQWMPDGMAFTVVNHKKFTLYKMAKLFNIRNMSSFVRKLGRWGFSRVHEKQSNNSDIFKHPDFKRGERATVKRKVRCLGRLIAAGTAQQQQQQQSMGMAQSNCYPGSFRSQMLGASTALRRDADFIVPMTGQGPLMEGTIPFHDGPSLNESNSRSSMYMEPTLERVTDASAASAEALYLSHRQFQQAKMERLVRDQQDLNEREIQNLLRQREMQQRELEAQKRRIMLEQQQLQEAALRSAALSGQDNRTQSSLASMRRTMPDLQHQDMARSFAPGSPNGIMRPGAPSAMDFGQHQGSLHEYSRLSQNPRGANVMDQQGLLDEQHQLQQMMALQERRAMMDQTQHSLDDSISRSMNSVRAPLSRMAPGTSLDSRMLSSPSGAISDEARAQQRKAVIQALLQEEQEWEMKRRGEAAVAMSALDQSQSMQHTNFGARAPISTTDEAWTTAREAQLRQLEQMKVQQQQQQQQQQQLMLMQQQQLLKQQSHYV